MRKRSSLRSSTSTKSRAASTISTWRTLRAPDVFQLSVNERPQKPWSGPMNRPAFDTGAAVG